MTDIQKCICNKNASNKCITKTCKTCCASKYCKKHNNNDYLELNENTCFMCGIIKYHNNFNKLNENYYFCENCYNDNRTIFDNIIQEQIFTKDPVFEIGKISSCFCGKMCSEYCIIKCCCKCCKVPGCNKHNPSIGITNRDNNKCTLCMKETPDKLNNYINTKIDSKIKYCNNCYIENKQILDRLLEHESCTIYDELKNQLDKELKKELEENFELFLEQYKDQNITKTILENKIKNHKNYCFSILMESDLDYECFGCNDIINICDTDICVSCNILLCEDNCIRILYEHCPNKNCYYCKKGNCHNNTFNSFCNDCYLDENEIFYEKYQYAIITKDTILYDDNDINLRNFDEYELDYQCPNCKKIKMFKSSEIRNCDDCESYICYDCSETNYVKCDKNNCKYCINKTCYNGIFTCICDCCDPQLKNNKLRPISPSIVTENKLEQCNVCLSNKKNYACVPCGHLCLCGECSNKITDKCPICNNEITSIIKIF